MPTYCYACPKCGAKSEKLKPMRLSNSLETCACGYVMVRDINSEGCWSENVEYHQPVFSNSMGVAPKQVRQAQALHPHIQYQRDGSIRIDSPAEYRRVRRDLGFVDRRPR
jgi:hypothetical protein